MMSALHLRIFGWWKWLWARTEGESPARPMATVRPDAGVAPAPPMERQVPAAPVALVPRVQIAEQHQGLMETLQLAALPAGATLTGAVADPERRARTLASLQSLKQIPALQSLAQGFTRSASRSDVSVEEVVAAVEKDPALCVRILRVANSVTISPEQKIEDIFTAVQMIGLMRVRNLADALFTLRGARTVAEGFDWRHLWIHAIATAAIAEEIEQRLGLSANPRLYLAALLHDVGKIVLSTVEPETYRAVLVESWVGGPRLEILEESRLGVGHAEAGLIFGQQSSLPDEVLATIEHHANPATAPDHGLTVAIVSLANFLSKTYGLGFSGARLEEQDGDFTGLPAWAVIDDKIGCRADRAMVDGDLHDFIIRLKPELLSLHA